MVKCPNFGEKSKIWSKFKKLAKIENLIKNQKFCQESKISPKIENLLKNPNFRRKSKNYLKLYLGTAYLITNCNTVTSKYVTLTELKNSYEEKRGEIEARAVKLVGKCYEDNYDMCLLLIRWKHKDWGDRTSLELAEQEMGQK